MAGDTGSVVLCLLNATALDLVLKVESVTLKTKTETLNPKPWLVQPKSETPNTKPETPRAPKSCWCA
jgi:hypothetical protein